MIPKKKVLIAFDLVNADSIASLNGVVRFIRDSHRWEAQLVLPPMSITESDIRAAESNRIDGILVNHPLGDNLSGALCASTVPLATIGNSDENLAKRRRRIIFSETDGEAIGRMAADYFTSRGGYRSVAFFGDATPTRWSRTRLVGFRETMKRRGLEVRILREPLADAVAALPKPAAIFLSGDYLASKIYAAIASARLEIPDEISVLGVDNNPFICDSVEPALSSIDRDTELQGFQAARALDRLMRTKRDSLHPVLLRTPPTKVVERLSTSFTTPVSTLLDRANAYIAAHALQGISPAEVAEHCNVSQSLLALRFRQYERVTVREKLLTLRLNEARRLLKTGHQRLEAIAEQCGFKSANRLSHLFIERYGVSPGKLRKTSRRQPQCA